MNDLYSVRDAQNDSGAGRTITSVKLGHISICVCTFRRPTLLAELLEPLLNQITNNQFSFSIVVVDNDRDESARSTVERFRSTMPPGAIGYFVEPTQSIALARNRATAQATGDYIAFIDDDEVPAKDWLAELYSALNKFESDGVLGPVKPRFAIPPPAWILKAGIFERPNSQDYPTGMVLHWNQTGTGSALLRRRVVDELDGPFQTSFASGGEDIDFFRRAIHAGKVFVWCNEAVAYETIPVERTRVSFQLKRALLRGKQARATPAGNAIGILKSIAACGIYTALLPFSLLLGRHASLKCLVKNCDHLGKLLAVFGLNPIKETYVSK